MKVRIVRRPCGEAPDWVRDAWIGLSLPLVERQQSSLYSVGVLSGPTSWISQLIAVFRGKAERVTGYLVNASEAVEQLAHHSPDAAAWWRENTPHLLDGKRNFLFDADACAFEPERRTRPITEE